MSQHPAYELFEELGRGVNTVVYRSYDLSLGREVAIKVLDENSRRDQRHRERFLREAQFLAQFEHDNVLRVHSVDTERGWIIMELMKGTLASIIAAGPSDPDLVRSVLKQTLDALAFLHEKHKVHGTVRPTNLLINDAGRVKLSEFEQTDVGGELRVPKGSKKYLAPELIRPEFGDFGPPLDLYCLGFTALELLKGPQFDSLFPGTGKGAIDPDIAWLRWHSSPDELASTRKLVKGIPDDLANVLDRMLKKRVADRPQSAREVLNELADKPLVAVPIVGATDDDNASPAGGAAGVAPAVVRTLASQSPRELPPQVTAAAAPAERPVTEKKPSKSAKPATVSGKLSAARFSKEWWNQQLGKPYVLYPLCAVILLGALWYSFFRKTGSVIDPVTGMVAVTFDVQPDSNGLEIIEAEKPIAANDDGTFPLKPGPHSVTFRKDGFKPVTKEFEVSADAHQFGLKLEPAPPAPKTVDVAISVSPADSKLTVNGTPQTLAAGTYTHKLPAGQKLDVSANHDGYSPASQSLSADDVARLGNKVSIALEPEKPAKPALPASLVAKPGADIDTDLNLPVRALSATLGDNEPLEFALVKPGAYKFGAPTDGRRPNELANRTVTIEQPFYIAINEVTNAQYQKFFDAGGASKAGTDWQKSATKWAELAKVDATKNHLPVTKVSPEQAQAFCAWVGGRLPTEVEWESAVRGSQDKGFPYPWGSDAVTRERSQIFHGDPIGKGFGPVPVEKLTAGTSGLGLVNALGNAAEICQDSEKPGSFILRGCSFQTANMDDIRVTWRGRLNARGDEDAGIRVVIPLTGATTGSPISSAASATKSVANSAQSGEQQSAKSVSSNESEFDLETAFEF